MADGNQPRSPKGSAFKRLSLHRVLATLAVNFFAAASMAHAVDILTPAGLCPGDTFRFIFVSTSTRNGSSRNIGVYDALVQTDAASYTYQGTLITVKAVASKSSVNARDNVGGLDTAVPVYLVTGTLVASNLGTWTGGLWSNSIAVPIDKKRDGN